MLTLSIFYANVVELYKSQAILKNIEIIHEQDDNVPLIYCDSNGIKQVFVNVLKNAEERMPNDGIITIQVTRGDSDLHYYSIYGPRQRH